MEESDEKGNVKALSSSSASVSSVSAGSAPPSAARRGGVMDGVSSAWLELVCSHK